MYNVPEFLVLQRLLSAMSNRTSGPGTTGTGPPGTPAIRASAGAVKGPAKAAVAAAAATGAAAKSAVRKAAAPVPNSGSSLPGPAQIRKSIEQFVGSLLDTPEKKLAAKIVVGTAAGALGAVALVKLVNTIRDNTGTTVPTITNPEQPVMLKYHGEKKNVTSDTKKFRFELPSHYHVSGIPVGQYVNITVTIDGKRETRPYTPISEPEERGFLDFVIKVQPGSGRQSVSQFIDKLSKGDEVTITGPIGLLTYQGMGVFQIKSSPNATPVPREIKRIGMLAQGSGVTVMVPILRAMLREPTETPKCSLVYWNASDQEIILKSELNSMATRKRKRFKLWYLADKPTSSQWKYGLGPLTAEIIKDWMPKPEQGVLILVSGPKEMTDLCKKILTSGENPYSTDMFYIYS